jgi:diaminohydroxyphosphoribosylaminopyrimidine deaminase/5-amino-6-(5-phosphoribosylamino)uracil reductase
MGEGTDERWMRRAIELAHLCPPAAQAYSVGAVIVDQDGKEIACGYSRESDSHVHAEESALAKLPSDDPRLGAATLYSTLEPCSRRASRPTPCAQLILEAGISRVVFAWREPSLFVDDCIGAALLAELGVAVTELTELAQAAMEPNRHLAI